jgi:hypothetical protein
MGSNLTSNSSPASNNYSKVAGMSMALQATVPSALTEKRSEAHKKRGAGVGTLCGDCVIFFSYSQAMILYAVRWQNRIHKRTQFLSSGFFEPLIKVPRIRYLVQWSCFQTSATIQDLFEGSEFP